MAGKAIGLILLGILFLAVIQSLAGGVSAFAHGVRYIPVSGGEGELASIDFSFVKQNAWESRYISQRYGATALAFLYVGGRHNGIDIPAKWGARVMSPVAGTVIATGNQDEYCPGRGYGKFVVLLSADNHALLFAHLSSIAAAENDAIARGDALGNAGQTGLATAPHLHFSVFMAQGFSMETRNGCGPDPTGRDIDPVPYLEAAE